MSWSVFTILNFASALTWTFVLVGSGFLFGSALENIVGDNWGLFSVGLLAVFVFITYLAWRHVKTLAKEASKQDETDPLSK
jgi:membrane protein DedA with SNARE-associated domain